MAGGPIEKRITGRKGPGALGSAQARLGLWLRMAGGRGDAVAYRGGGSFSLIEIKSGKRAK